MGSEDARARLEQLDDALLRLRRVWSGPPALVLETGEAGQVTMSNVLVAEACARVPGEVGVGEVAQFLDVEHSTASRLVDRAVRAGLVTRTPSAVDARRVALALSASGEALRERAVGFRLAWLGSVLGGWDRGEVAELAVSLTRFADAVGVAGAPGGAPAP